MFALAIVAATTTLAHAHEMRPSHLTLRHIDDSATIEVVWQVALANNTPMPLELRLPESCQRLKLSKRWATRTVRGERFVIDCGSDALNGLSVHVTNLDKTGTDVIVHSGGGVWILSATEPSVTVPVALSNNPDAPPSPGVWAYLTLGIEHILVGLDHLLFVLGLLLLVGPNWKRLLATTGAFTLAHSITLTLAAYELVSFPSQAVEAIIALSIVALARELSVSFQT